MPLLIDINSLNYAITVSAHIHLSHTVILKTIAKGKLYTGSSIRPEVTITDAEGNDISRCFTVTYGENTKVGTGSITVTGRPDMGYYGAKTLKFTILPKWAKWIFG